MAIWNKYSPKEYPWHLYSRNPSQITNTLEYYINERGADLSLPPQSDITPKNEVSIFLTFPIAKVDHKLKVNPVQGFTIDVNANAFDYLRSIVKNPEKYKRGDLFKIQNGLSNGPVYFVSTEVMQGLQNYDWNQHTSQIDQWLGQLETDLKEINRNGLKVGRVKDPHDNP
jgi:hypothetical protein